MHKFLPGMQLVHVRNNGVAFGFLSGGGAVVLVVTLVALAALLVYFVLRPTGRGCGCRPGCCWAARSAT